MGAPPYTLERMADDENDSGARVDREIDGLFDDIDGLLKNAEVQSTLPSGRNGVGAIG